MEEITSSSGSLRGCQEMVDSVVGKEIQFESVGNSNIRVRVNGRVKMNEKWDEIQGKLNLVRVGGECELSEFEIQGFCSTSEGKKTCEVNRANNFCRKIKAEGSVTFQNIFSSMADFSAVVSVIPCSPPE